jgi:hypothetical protein
MNNEKTFSVTAKTCTLKYNSQKNGETIFGDVKDYSPYHELHLLFNYI